MKGAPVPDGSHQDWFRDWFDEDYLELYQHRDEAEARAFLSVLRDRYGRFGERGTVDLACGAGRHAWVMAGEFGWPVTGLDLSPSLLRVARQHHPDGEFRATPGFVRGDLRALPLADGCAALAVNLFTSFGYFSRDADHAVVIGEMARVLKPDGVLVMDLLNPTATLATLVPEDESTRGRWHIHQRREYHRDSQRIEKTIEMTRDDGRTRTVTESVRLFSGEELTTLFARAGLGIREVWGNYDGHPFHPDHSPRRILIAEPEPTD